ncbi:MAG: membrane-bound lytic murein transglycosylase F [Gammaproteobacteria bacterium]|jgi:membrane-bound lytic murein transglycosylase F
MEYSAKSKLTRILILPLMILLGSCDSLVTQLETIRQRDEIRIVTIYSPTTYFIDSDSETGFEFELARMFAERLNLNLKIIIAANRAEMVDILMKGEADVAVGLIKQTFDGNKILLAGPEYYNVIQQVIYKRGVDRPDSVADLYPFQLHIAEGGIRPEKLNYMKQYFSEFSWKFHADVSSNDIIKLIETDQIAYAVVYSNEFLLAQQTNPELNVAFDISEPTPLAWFTNNTADKSLSLEIEIFFKQLEQNESLAELVEYFYGPVQKFDYVDQQRFISRFTSRLPQYKSHFETAAAAFNFDWRMLAAMSYQESHWNERARSPTGVRGLMMLTLITAKQMGVTNRLDPEQSIMGGARYIDQLIKKIPERIQDPDRMWFALASYNIGFGHLEDARKITEKQGGNPDKWQEVKNYLPYLQNSQWYKQTLYGYARGNQAVSFVESIRKYYNTLVQLTHNDEPIQEMPTKESIRMVDLDSKVL